MKDANKTPGASVIDFGAHLYPEPVFPEAAFADNPLADLLGARLSDPEVFIEDYAAAGIDAAVLSQPYYMGHDDLQATTEANDALLEIIADYEQLYGLGAIPVGAGGEAAAREFERCLENGYHGGALETKSHGTRLTDSSLTPVYEVAEQYDAPILVHPKLDDTLHPEVLDDTHLLNAIFGREVGLAASIVDVVHDGLLDRHPDLDLVFHHYGGNIASMVGRIHLQLDDGRWPDRQDHVKPYESFNDQFEERIYIDTCGFFGYQAPLRASLEEFPPSQILFATDFPFEGRDSRELAAYVDTVSRTTSRSTARQILAENTRELLANGA